MKYILTIVLLFFLTIFSACSLNKPIIKDKNIQKDVSSTTSEINGACNKEDNCCTKNEDCKYIWFTGECNTPEYVAKVQKESEAQGRSNTEAPYVGDEEAPVCICENAKCVTRSNQKTVSLPESSGIWAPTLYKVEITKNGSVSTLTNCCGGSLDGIIRSGYLKIGEIRYAIYNNGASSDYIDIYFIRGLEEDFPSPTINKDNITTSDQNEFNIDYFRIARIKKGQTVILNNSTEEIRIKFIETAGIQSCPPGEAC